MVWVGTTSLQCNPSNSSTYRSGGTGAMPSYEPPRTCQWMVYTHELDRSGLWCIASAYPLPPQHTHTHTHTILDKCQMEKGGGFLEKIKLLNYNRDRFASSATMSTLRHQFSHRTSILPNRINVGRISTGFDVIICGNSCPGGRR